MQRLLSSTAKSWNKCVYCRFNSADNACAWSIYYNSNAPGGQMSRYIDLASCQAACIQNPYCIGLDIDLNQGASIYCWLTVAPQASGTLSYYQNAVHYTLARNVGCPYYGQ